MLVSQCSLQRANTLNSNNSNIKVNFGKNLSQYARHIIEAKFEMPLGASGDEVSKVFTQRTGVKINHEIMSLFCGENPAHTTTIINGRLKKGEIVKACVVFDAISKSHVDMLKEYFTHIFCKPKK